MTIIEIIENESIACVDEDLRELQKIKKEVPSLPFCIREKRLILNDYTIGEISFNDKLLRIKPRHKILTLNHYFEMLLYINNLKNNSIKSISYSDDSVFGVQNLIENFVSLCSNLINFGLTGIFIEKFEKTFRPQGRIQFDKYKRPLIPIEGLSTIKEDYEINNFANQIIKTALLKVCDFSYLNDNIKFDISKILVHFSDIDVYKKNYDNMKFDISNFYSSNPYYSMTLEYAFKIIFDFRLGYSASCGSQWNAFLENSNDTFEKYIRILLSRELKHKVEKWEKPKKFAQLNWEEQVGEKSFSPDIIVDYINGKSRAIFDVKNKNFTPTNNLSDVVNVADIYQLLFYAQQLKTDVCGLVYPSDDFYMPISLDIIGFDIKFFLISINMHADFEKRKNIFLKNINYCLMHS